MTASILIQFRAPMLEPSALTSTLTASASSFATDSSVTLTFTARDAASNLVVGYTPAPESGVV